MTDLMNDLVIAKDSQGRMVLAIPFVLVDEYFESGPRWSRWLIYLDAAVVMSQARIPINPIYDPNLFGEEK